MSEVAGIGGAVVALVVFLLGFWLGPRMQAAKTRGVERERFRLRSYAKLWATLKPLALYSADPVNKHEMDKLLRNLTNWYYSVYGGHLLTAQLINFYMALQDLLWDSSSVDDWEASRPVRSTEDPMRRFGKMLKARQEDQDIAGALQAFEYFVPKTDRDWQKETSDKETSEVEGKWNTEVRKMSFFRDESFRDWQTKAPVQGKKWRKGIKKLAALWPELQEEERFVTLQQVASILRTTLTYDLESRLG